MKKILPFVIFFYLVLNPLFSFAQVVPDLLKNAIDAKTKELQEIHQQLETTQQSLIETEKKSRGLGQELKKINSTINQLNLNIKSSEVNIDKLGFEITSLQSYIQKSQEEINSKSIAINKILRELQIRDNEDPFIAFLKYDSLSESLAELDNLIEVRRTLAQEIADLTNLKEESQNRLGLVSKKKEEISQEHRASKIKKSLVEDQKEERARLLATTKSQEKLYEELIDELAKKQTEIAEEIEALEAGLRGQIDPNLLPPKRPGVLGWPIAEGYRKITQGHGATKFARYAYKGKWHNGIDFGAPTGTTVLAAEDGIVLNIGDQDKFCWRGAYGKYIVIKHSNNLVTLYAHLSKQIVSPGTQVKRGEEIGYVGRTGYSTGSHLHLTVYDSQTFKMRPTSNCGLMPSGGDINPSNYL